MIPAAILVWVVLIPASVIGVSWLGALRRERGADRLPIPHDLAPVTTGLPAAHRRPAPRMKRPDCVENVPAPRATDRDGEARRARS